MPRRTYHLHTFAVGVAFITATAALAQVAPSASGGATEEDEHMMIPPMLTGTPYANEAGADVRQNVFTTALTVNAAYDDNVLPAETPASGGGTPTYTPVADEEFLLAPVISYLRSTPKQQESLEYNPSFTFYAPKTVLGSANTTTLDSVNQSADGVFQGQLNSRVSLGLQDGFVRTSNIFDQSFPFSSIGLGGSTQAPTPAAIAPYAEQLRNQATAFLTYQFSKYAMIGGSGSFANMRFPNPSQSVGLYNSDGSSGSVFFDRRFSRSQYLGVTYGYDWVQAFQASSRAEIQTHEVLGFYSVFFNRNFSVSAAAGTKYAITHVVPVQTPAVSWNPEVVLSLGWQGNKGNISSSFLRTVASGGGLIGAYNSVSANLAGGWKIQRSWTARMSFTYENIEPVSYLAGLPYQGGNSLMAEGSMEHSFGSHISMQFGYQRLHEEYVGVQAISADPDSDRGYVNVNYQLRKPLGR